MHDTMRTTEATIYTTDMGDVMSAHNFTVATTNNHTYTCTSFASKHTITTAATTMATTTTTMTTTSGVVANKTSSTTSYTTS